MNLKWSKRDQGNWYSLYLLSSDDDYLNDDCFDNLHGVYVIFTALQTTDGGVAIDVGLGEIRMRLKCHRREFEGGPDYMNLKVTWAEVPADSQGGVENYLRQELKPSMGERFSDDPPIVVNLPWPPLF